MHVVTKILVILAAILSVFLSALVISYSVNADRIVADYQNEQLRRAASEAALATAAAQHAEELDRVRKERDASNDKIASQNSMLSQLQLDSARLTKDKAVAEGQRDSQTSQIDQLNETVKTLTALIAGYRKEVTDSRTTELAVRKQSIELEDRISDLESQLEVATQARRQLEEQLAEARRAIETALANPGGDAKSAQPFIFSGGVISGRVDEVSTDPATGALLAKISVGTNDGVRPNMKMFISRGSDFVANLIIIQADLNFSVGRVELLGRTGFEPRNGDTVLSRLQ